MTVYNEIMHFKLNPKNWKFSGSCSVSSLHNRICLFCNEKKLCHQIDKFYVCENCKRGKNGKLQDC